MEGNIRSIRIGDVFAGKLITVGQINKVGARDISVTSIVLDLPFLKEFGIDKYDVYAKDTLGYGSKFVWQSFQRQAVAVTYECGR